jgi:cyclopropane fatty-acyl-phospholipid synthase-like methyltransferase
MFKFLVCFLVFINSSYAADKKYHHKKGRGQHHRFDNAKKWSKIFEDSNRDKWQNPDLVLKTVGIKKNSIIADIGSATGYFPVRLSKVATKGRVWGIDIEPNLVNFLNKRAKREKITNLYSILGTYSDPLIPETVDFIFMVNTYHHISKRKQYFKKLKSSLKENGKLVIIDFKQGKLPFGPKDKMKIKKAQIIKELNDAGHKLVADHEILKYQYFLVFQ